MDDKVARKDDDTARMDDKNKRSGPPEWTTNKKFLIFAACHTLDPSTMAWVSANMPTHCDDLELLAQKQNLLATSAAGLFTGGPTAEELFTRASGCRSKRLHYQHRLYRNPWAKYDAAVAVQEIATSFKERAWLEESGASSCDAEAAKTAKAKPEPKVKAKAKARAKKQPA